MDNALLHRLATRIDARTSEVPARCAAATLVATAAYRCWCGAAKGGRHREVGMDDWAWEQVEPWLRARLERPVGPLCCVVNAGLEEVLIVAGFSRQPRRLVASA